jgi:hypothetical protein
MRLFSKATSFSAISIKTLWRIAEDFSAHALLRLREGGRSSHQKGYPHMLWIRLCIDQSIPPRNGVK